MFSLSYQLQQMQTNVKKSLKSWIYSITRKTQMYLSKCQFTLIENIRWSNDWQTKTLIYEVFVCVLISVKSFFFCLCKLRFKSRFKNILSKFKQGLYFKQWENFIIPQNLKIKANPILRQKHSTKLWHIKKEVQHFS